MTASFHSLVNPASAHLPASGRHASPVWRSVLTHALLLGASVLFLFPFFWMVLGSFKTQGELFGRAFTLLPTRITLQNYEYAFKAVPLARNFFNSVFIATSFAILSLFFCTLAGFAFAKYKFPGREAMFAFLLGTLMLPKMVSIVPLFIIISRLGWINTYYAVIVPGAASAFGIFFMRQYIRSLPDELLDAARVDGCGDVALYWRIVLPNITPAIATLGIMEFIGSWNNFLWPLIVMRTYRMYTVLQAVILLPASEWNTPWAAILAGCTISVIPLIVLFLLCQRWFVSGAVTGAVRG